MDLANRQRPSLAAVEVDGSDRSDGESPDARGPEVAVPRILGGNFADPKFFGINFDIEECLVATTEVAGVIDIQKRDPLIYFLLRTVPMLNVSHVRVSVHNG